MSTEDKVRDALADLAPRVPAGDEALAGMRRAITRRRRRRTAVRAAVAAVLLVAVATVGVVALAGGEEGSELDMSEDPATTTDVVAEVVDGRVQIGPLSLEMPDGWVIVEEVPEQRGGGWICIAPPDNPYPKFGNCSGLVVRRGYLPGNEMNSYEEGRDWAWYHATDAAPCPTGENIEDSVVAVAGSYAPIDTRSETVGGTTAEFTEWAAECSLSGYRFNPRMWVVLEHRIMIEDVVGDDETEDILASVEFTDE